MRDNQQSVPDTLGTQKQPDKPGSALEYMEEKYGEPFEYVAPWGDSMTGTQEMLVSCGSLPGEKILVEVENYRSEDRIYRDNLLAIKYKEETADFLRGCADAVFGEANVFYEVSRSALSADLPADASFEEYLADTRVPLVILIEVKESNFASRNQAEQLAELVTKNGTHCRLSLVVMDTEEYGTFDRATLGKKLAYKEYVDYASIKNLDGNFQITWYGRE